MSKERDLYQELRSIGLTHDQVSEVLKWVDTLPMNCEYKNLPKGEIAISSKSLTDPDWKD